jgi:hypothetical protein
LGGKIGEMGEMREMGEIGGIRKYFLLNLPYRPHFPYLNKNQPLIAAPIARRLNWKLRTTLSTFAIDFP